MVCSVSVCMRMMITTKQQEPPLLHIYAAELYEWRRGLDGGWMGAGMVAAFCCWNTPPANGMVLYGYEPEWEHAKLLIRHFVITL